MADRPNENDAPRSRRHEEAIDLAAKAAARHGLSADAFRDSVLAVRDDVDTYHRALHTVEARTVALRSTPGPGRSQDPRPLPDASSVDPWTVDLKGLAEGTRVVGWCPACLGSGATKCSACRGAGKVKCPRCNATGRDPRGGGDCGQCAGQKKVPCSACRGGRIECAECRSAGEVEAWLEVERSTRQVVCVHPMGAAARAHPRVAEAADFDADPTKWPDSMAEDTGTRAPSELPAGLAPKLKSNERVVATRTQRFQTVVHLVTYATALSTGVVNVGGVPPEVSPTSDWRPAELRRIVTVGAGALMLGAALFVSVSYHGRHAWFARQAHGPLVVSLACALALACAFALSGLTLAPRARTPLRLWVPAGALMLLVGATALVVARDRPRAAGARSALARGDVAGARVEAEALRALGVDPAAGAAVLDQIHLRELRAAAPDVARMVAVAQRPWGGDDAREQGVRAVAEAIERAADAPGVRGDPDGLQRLADAARGFSPPLRDRLQRDAAMLRARACAERGDGACVREQTAAALQHGADPATTGLVLRRAEERTLEHFRARVAEAESAETAAARVGALEAALALAERYNALSRGTTSPTTQELRARLERAREDAAHDALRGSGARHHGRR